MFQHAKGHIEQDASNENQIPEKLKTIIDIINAGLEVGYIIHRHGMDDKTAFEVEAALMDAYPSLSNSQSGQGSNEFGIMHAKEIINKYNAEVADFEKHGHRLLMINVNKSVANESKTIYEAVRYAWKIDKNKAGKADYILAVKQGIIKGVYVANKWLQATQENFPALPEDMPKRFGFEGVEANDEIKNLYINKVIPKEYRKKGAANPIKYSRMRKIITTNVV